MISNEWELSDNPEPSVFIIHYLLREAPFASFADPFLEAIVGVAPSPSAEAHQQSKIRINGQSLFLFVGDCRAQISAQHQQRHQKLFDE